MLALPALALLVPSGGCIGQGEFAVFTDLVLPFNTSEAPSPAPPTGPGFFTEAALFDAIPGMIGHHAATITAFPDGELLAAWYSYTGPHELDGSAIYMARRPAGDDAWQPPQLHIDRPAGDGNPVLYSQGDDVWLFQAVIPFGWSTAHIEMQRSEDRGGTWTPPVVIDGPLGANTRYPPVRLNDGRLLLPAYDDLWQRTLFYISTDGVGWQLQPIIDNGSDNRPIQPSVVQLAGGRLLAVMRNTGGQWLWVTASDDLGQTWSRPTDSGFANPGSAAALAKLATGHLILVFNDHPTQRSNLTVAMSEDDGLTWPWRRLLAADDESRSYPSIVQSPDGRVHILYSLSRRSIQHVTVDEPWIMGAGG
jgi:predicted neuraminidase